MIPDEVSCFIRSTYKKDIFRYKGYSFSRICAWVDKQKPDSIIYFKQLLKRIKEDEKQNDERKKLVQKDKTNENGWYLPLRIGNTDKNMVIYFEKAFVQNKNPPEVGYYDIYEFKIEKR
jgi:hypothetical protein